MLIASTVFLFSYFPGPMTIYSAGSSASYTDYSIYIRNIQAGKYKLYQHGKVEGSLNVGSRSAQFQTSDGSVDAVMVHVQEIQLVDSLGNIVSVEGNPGVYDLLDLKDDAIKLFSFHSPVPVGKYVQIRLILDDSGNRVLVDGVEHPLKVPSGSTSGLKLDGEFDVVSGFFTRLTFEFGGELVRQNRGIGYRIQPVVRLLEVETTPPFVTGYLLVKTHEKLDITLDEEGLPRKTGIAGLDAITKKNRCFYIKPVADDFSEKSGFDTELAAETGLDREYIFFFAPETDIILAMKDYLGEPAVEHVTPDMIMEGAVTSVNDPFANKTPDPVLDDDAQVSYLQAIRAYEGWDFSRGSSSIRVAVLDSGINDHHPDLAGRVIQGRAFYNGYCTFGCVPGCAMCAQYPCPRTSSSSKDVQSHGTHVAGILGASTDNALGIAGINWKSKILSHRVMQLDRQLDHDSSMSCKRPGGVCYATSNFKKGVVEAISNGARVINFSGGGYGLHVCYLGFLCYNAAPDYESAVKYAELSGAVLVASAGNDSRFFCPAPDHNRSCGYESHFPASYNSVISVASLNVDAVNPLASKQTSGFSNFGKIDVAAPGGYILSTVPYGSGYDYFQGTSMAAPMVAGLASLVLSVNPDLSPAEVRSLIYKNARDIGPGGGSAFCSTTTGKDGCSGHGVIDLAATLNATPATGGSGPGGSCSGCACSATVLFPLDVFHQFGYLGAVVCFLAVRRRKQRKSYAK